MKKALLATSIALMCAGASAQSYVNVYGRVNLSLEHLKDGPTDSNQMVDNSSRWGLIGSEDLGGGLKALFNLEAGFDASNGGGKGSTSVRTTNVGGTDVVTGVSATTKAWSRESWVGLASNYGTLRLGAMTSPLYFASADYVSMHNHDTGTSADILYDTMPNGSYAAGGGGFPMTNTFAYKTPEFSGFSAEYAQSMSEDVQGAGGVRNISVNYDNGNLHLGGGYGETKPLGSSISNSIFVVRGLYDFGAVVLGGYIELDRFDDKDRTNVRVAAMFPVGNHEFHLNYGQASDVSGSPETGARQGTAGYNYNLSKRTKVYAFFTLIQNDNNAAYGVSEAGKTFRSVAAGFRHNF